MTGTIVLTCWEKDKPVEIQLEPWAISYKLEPGSEIKFTATQPTSQFYWTLRIDYDNNGVQLFPESSEHFGSIQVLINNEVIDTVD